MVDSARHNPVEGKSTGVRNCLPDLGSLIVYFFSIISAAAQIRRNTQESAMPDDFNNQGPEDNLRVNVHEAGEVKYWMDKWGCTEEELRAGSMWSAC